MYRTYNLGFRAYGYLGLRVYRASRAMMENQVKEEHGQITWKLMFYTV